MAKGIGITSRPRGGLPGRDYVTGAEGYITPSAQLQFKDGYSQRMYEQAAREAVTPGSMGYGDLPQMPNESWNDWKQRQSDFENAFGNGSGIATGGNAMNKILGLDSASRASRSGGGGGMGSRGGGGVSYGGGGPSMSAQGRPIEFYLGPTPTLEQLNLNYEELGKRAMETNAPYAQQYQQWAPGAQAGTAALSNLGATMSTGQLSRDMAGQVGRGAAALGYSTGLGSRSGIGRNLLARDLGLSSLQVQQQGMDFLNKSSLLAQQAQQAMSPIAPTEIFGTAANQASYNNQIQNQNLLNAWLSQGLPGQFDITKGQYIGFQPGTYSATRPLDPSVQLNWGKDVKGVDLQGKPLAGNPIGGMHGIQLRSQAQNWTGSAYTPQYKYG